MQMPSAKDHGEVVESYLAGEVPAGRIIGPLSASTTSKVKVQINSLGSSLRAAPPVNGA